MGSTNRSENTDIDRQVDPDRSHTRKYFRPVDRKKVRRSRIKRFLLFSLMTVLFLGLGGVFTYFYYYDHYEQIVRERMETGFWQSRAGIYAAPRTIRPGQRIDRDSFVSLLRRSGYTQGDSKDTFWNGNFDVKGSTIEITSNRLPDGNGGRAKIDFEEGRIVRVVNEDSLESAVTISPEMLTGRSETKRSGVETLKYSQIPDDLKNAIIVTEDRRFFEHNGIDPRGILRAVWANLTEQKIVQGGSTITQQLVKNTFLTNERTFQRKFAEAFLSLALENSMSKEEIFTLYCNEIYLGQYGISGIHGFGMASRAYFDKDIKDLSLSEAATLAAIIRNPNHFTLGSNDSKLTARRDMILGLLLEQNAIDRERYEKAVKEEVVFRHPKVKNNAIAPYFVDSVTTELPGRVYLDDSSVDENLRVYTTLDTNLQEMAEKAVENHLEKLSKQIKKEKFSVQATLVALDPHTGEVLALVGGDDYAETQYNRATQARRQPGSAFKPFVFATALERGYLPSSVFSDSATEFAYDNGRSYSPANYGNSYSNEKITLKTALARSSNVVAVQTAMRSGLHNVVRKASEFGFENIQEYPSVALGTMEVTPLQLAAAYASFANGGKKIEPVFIREVMSGEGASIYRNNVGNEHVISEQTAYMITDMLRAAVERGTARGSKDELGENIVFAGKTGSSNDAWFAGYTPNLVTIAWVGYDENEDLGLTGGEAALPLWTDFMKQVVRMRPEFGGRGFVMPAGLEETTIDPETGMVADPNCPRKEKVVVPKTAVSALTCFRHKVYPETEYALYYEIPERLKGAEFAESGETADPSGPDAGTDLNREVREMENGLKTHTAKDPQPAQQPRSTAPAPEKKPAGPESRAPARRESERKPPRYEVHTSDVRADEYKQRTVRGTLYEKFRDSQR